MSNKRTNKTIIESVNELSIASKLIENGISMTPNFKLSKADSKPIEGVGRKFLKDDKNLNILPF